MRNRLTLNLLFVTMVTNPVYKEWRKVSMLQSLKQKTLVGKLWAIIVLAVAAIFIGVVFGPESQK